MNPYYADSAVMEQSLRKYTLEIVKQRGRQPQYISE
jgi:hypothetical protein